MKSLLFSIVFLLTLSQSVFAYEKEYDKANKQRGTGSSFSQSRTGQQRSSDERAVYGGQKPRTEQNIRYDGGSSSGNHCPSNHWENPDGTCHKM
jgi:hypothetical protein